MSDVITVGYKENDKRVAKWHDGINQPRMMVARPRAVPIPRPRMAFGPTRLNLLNLSPRATHQCISTYIGAFCSMSGTIKNRTMLPLM